EELCARPLGAADYIEIAEYFHTVLLENIPKLTPSNREEAARFRTLIDALYEAKVKLIASADAEPSELYPAGDQSFEFERTASRLMEMRSQGYLALPRRDAEWRQGVAAARPAQAAKAKRDVGIDVARGLLMAYVVIVIHGTFWLRLVPQTQASFV